ncbi:Pyrroline-5-carboxylate reductase [Ignisphaera aggregans DSM 17230]|uniref:Pyrroline-5-carboxylate reductase n=1 Tax=Ignisphaera aggregans (strain DSM 17230 / JCM 13409 / AQ1.S1) TaxID=583356 RepID=E0SSF2_IGNAA|nr:Pyrroline-5-carboxylate reductase [Ignisphaera aggregans DSM 17230]
MDMDIGVIGIGRMGRAIIKGFISGGIDPKKIYVYDVSPMAIESIRGMGVNICSSNIEVVRSSNLVILAVKPSQVRGVAEDISRYVDGKIVISIAAFIQLKMLEKILSGARIYRVMPNIGVEVNTGFIAITPPSAMDSNIDRLFRLLGEVVWVDEDVLDLLTLMSASTPALIAEIADALILASLKAGIPYDIAKKATAHVLQGVGKLLLYRDTSSIRDSVITPRGTTIELIERIYTEEAKSRLLSALIKTIEKYLELLEKYKSGS